ncbi:MAG: hypothetical protein PW792_13960 [Acidobacteriaceae bacterium]|nr:hypothetical protein [Acidobacteriaceae bacterium]
MSSPFARTLAVFAVPSLALLVSGCGMGSGNLLQSATTSSNAAALHGSVLGGQQPIYNSQITLWQAGNTGYGQGATNLMHSGVDIRTAADGTFNMTGTYDCPTSGSPMVYLVASGGDPTGGASSSVDNTAAVLVAALGNCGNLSASTFINVNEVTTAAAAFALGQFVGGFGGSTVSIGTSSTNLVGLNNAFATAHNLASTTTGVATGTSAASGTNYYLPSSDQSKLNTMANILAACVNVTDASQPNCLSLFAAVAPSGATAPTDIFQAATYLSLNPISVNSATSSTNMTTLFNLQSAFQPFSPSLSAVPTDWTMAIAYTGTGINYLSSAAVDANGDVWFSNQNTTGGVVVLNGGTGVAGGSAGVAGGVIGFYSSGANSGGTTITAGAVRQVAIDTNGKAWFGSYTAAADSKYYLFRAVSGSGVDAVYAYTAGNNAPYAVAVDGNNTVYTTTNDTHLDYISATAVNTTSPSFDTTHLGGATVGLAVTGGSVVYAPRQANAAVYNFTTNPLGAATSGTATSFSNYGTAADGNGHAWVVNKNAVGGTSGVNLGYLSGTSFTAAPSSACLNAPNFPAVDGNNNIWVTNASATSGITTVCEFNSSGTLISSATGFGPHGLATARGIAIDQSGNVWVTSNGTSYSYVTELVGAAVPAVAPLSLAAKNNTLGQRP